jgi:hypothetical protein
MKQNDEIAYFYAALLCVAGLAGALWGSRV